MRNPLYLARYQIQHRRELANRFRKTGLALFTMWEFLYTSREMGFPIRATSTDGARSAHRWIQVRRIRCIHPVCGKLFQRRWWNRGEGDIRYIFLDDSWCAFAKRKSLYTLYTTNAFLNLWIALCGYPPHLSFPGCARNASLPYFHFRITCFTLGGSCVLYESCAHPP